jgi:hypothetical protein
LSSSAVEAHLKHRPSPPGFISDEDRPDAAAMPSTDTR